MSENIIKSGPGWEYGTRESLKEDLDREWGSDIFDSGGFNFRVFRQRNLHKGTLEFTIYVTRFTSPYIRDRFDREIPLEVYAELSEGWYEKDYHQYITMIVFEELALIWEMATHFGKSTGPWHPEVLPGQAKEYWDDYDDKKGKR